MQQFKINISSVPDEYFDDLMVRMAHHSTAIEGNTLTQGETKSVLIDGYVPRAIDLRELNEVLNYKNFTKHMLEDLRADRAITTEFIKEVHGILCHEAIESVPGRFKTQPNMVRILFLLLLIVCLWIWKIGFVIWLRSWRGRQM